MLVPAVAVAAAAAAVEVAATAEAAAAAVVAEAERFRGQAVINSGFESAKRKVNRRLETSFGLFFE